MFRNLYPIYILNNSIIQFYFALTVEHFFWVFWIGISFNEILQHQLRVGEVTSMVFIGLSMYIIQSFFQVFVEVNMSFETGMFEQIFVFFKEFFGSVVDIFLEELHFERLSLVLVENMRKRNQWSNRINHLQSSESSVSANDTPVVGSESSDCSPNKSLAEQRVVVHDWVDHFVFPLGVIWV